MTVQDYLERAFALYVYIYDSPNPAINRLRALNQAFQSSCFKWYDGYLLEYADELRAKSKPKPYGTKWVPNKKEKQRIENNVQVRAEMLERKSQSEIVQKLFTKRNIPRLSDDDNVFTPSSLVFYSALPKIPDDVRPDWLEAAIEYTDLLESFYSDPEQYKRDFYYPSEARMKDEDRRIAKKAGVLPASEDIETDEGLDALLASLVSDEKKPVAPYVPDPVVEEKLTKAFEKHLKEQRKYITNIRERIAEIKASRV